MTKIFLTAFMYYVRLQEIERVVKVKTQFFRKCYKRKFSNAPVLKKRTVRIGVTANKEASLRWIILQPVRPTN